ncbi:hypothetical protein BUALT_Bualt18G0057600 [Buddleja alternifolia]|uniref:Uncharacterized protein n=1 Tax=Buddleja alternifolia TaxID=168488 RepID=A0AAV6W431_9LAMI|nr:hypothetical protein BUALT_Bualt18G0057600 [Buddleja alternifolia]
MHQVFMAFLVPDFVLLCSGIYSFKTGSQSSEIFGRRRAWSADLQCLGRRFAVGVAVVLETATEKRPVMSSVLMLANGGASLPEPKEPGFVETSSSSNAEDHIDISISKESKKSSITITELEPK